MNDEDLEVRGLLYAAERRAPDPDVCVAIDTDRFERITRLRRIRRALSALGLAGILGVLLLPGSGRDDATVDEPLVGSLAQAIVGASVEDLSQPTPWERKAVHPDDLRVMLRLERVAAVALADARRLVGDERVEALRKVEEFFPGTEAAEFAAWSREIEEREEGR